jgi:CRISPR system Cascade subunit CasE
MSIHPTFYLTRIRLPYFAAAQLQARDAHDWHQRLWEAFPGRDGQPRDFLTRVDRQDDGLQCLILSPRSPARPGWCPPACWASKEIPPKFFDHTGYQFSLVANPSKKIRAFPDGSRTKNGHRVALTDPAEQLGWLGRKAAASGFEVDPESLQTIPRGRETFVRRGVAGAHGAVEFRGALTVLNRDLFLTAFQTGIGPAKAFGFGLLVLSPLA